MSELKITPLVQILSDSWSSLLVPIFPIWGKVKLIICPAYEGSDIIILLLFILKLPLLNFLVELSIKLNINCYSWNF